MNIERQESLIETAFRLMRSKKKPKDLEYITKEVFQMKGIHYDKSSERTKAQFQLDFMTSGHFVCCGENKKGLKLWDIKDRQPSSLLDKDGTYLEDLYVDEDAIINELKDEDDIDEDEDDDELETKDDIEEELDLEKDEDEDDDITETLIDDDFDDLEDKDEDE